MKRKGKRKRKAKHDRQTDKRTDNKSKERGCQKRQESRVKVQDVQSRILFGIDKGNGVMMVMELIKDKLTEGQKFVSDLGVDHRSRSNTRIIL